MESRKLFTRRFVFGILFILSLSAVNIALFYYIRLTTQPWYFVEKNDGTILLGKASLLEGGYVEIDRVYAFSSLNHLQGSSEGTDFRIESLNPAQVTIVRTESLDRVRIAPSEVKQWGEISPESRIYQQLKNENR